LTQDLCECDTYQKPPHDKTPQQVFNRIYNPNNIQTNQKLFLQNCNRLFAHNCDFNQSFNFNLCSTCYSRYNYVKKSSTDVSSASKSTSNHAKKKSVSNPSVISVSDDDSDFSMGSVLSEEDSNLDLKFQVK
ncbi:2820_t:CDS:1, partial [Racocetra fulgida]